MKYYKVILLSLLLLASVRLYSDEQNITEHELLQEDQEAVHADLNEVKKNLKIPAKAEAVKSKKKPVKVNLKKQKISETRVSGQKQKAKNSSGSTKTQSKSGKTPAVTADVKQKKKISQKVSISGKPVPLKKDSDKIIPGSEIKKSTDKNISAEPEKKLNDTDLRTVQNLKEQKPDNDQPVNRDTIIINPTLEDAIKRNFRVLPFSEIDKWGKPRGLKVLADLPPISDNLAFFLPKYSAEFRIEGYNRNEIYRLYIDFVRYSGNINSFNSGLKIWGRSKNGKMFLISDINHKALQDAKIFETLIPYELSYPGFFDIIIKEYSDTPGKWGIWDMIISTKKIDRIEILKSDKTVKPGGTEVKIFE